MVSRNCLLFQLMKQKSVYSNQEKTFFCIYSIIISVEPLFNDDERRNITDEQRNNTDDLGIDAFLSWKTHELKA